MGATGILCYIDARAGRALGERRRVLEPGDQPWLMITNQDLRLW